MIIEIYLIRLTLVTICLDLKVFFGMYMNLVISG